MRLLLLLVTALKLTCLATAELPCDPSCQHGYCEADHGSLSCRCEHNWFGSACNDFVCDVKSDLCGSNGTCVRDPTNSNSYICGCQFPTLGRQCQYTAHGASCLNVYCGEHGQCYGDPDGAAACVCDDNHFGARCQYNGSNLCDAPNVRQCHGHGTCDIFLLNAGSPTARCKCDLENIYQDLSFCSELDPDNNPCYFTNPCLNGGNCVPSINNYTCACPPTWIGRNCMVPYDVCAGQCAIGESCSVIAGGHYFECTALTNGSTSTNTPILPTAPSCTGIFPSFCLNNGFLEMGDLIAPSCQCVVGFTGLRCEIRDVCGISNACTSHTQAPHCINTLTATTSITTSAATQDAGYVCVCESGWGGTFCDDDLDECLRETLCHAGNCSNLPGSYECSCPVGWTGPQCEVVLGANCSHDGDADVCGENGACKSAEGGVVCVCKKGYTGELCQTQLCEETGCAELAANGQCDNKCNSPACGHDGFDCAPDGADPWSDCPTPHQCKLGYGDGQCTVACNQLGCLYDASECLPKLGECTRSEECLKLVRDGVCQSDCYSLQCLYDFQDCQYKEDVELIDNRLVLILFSELDRPFTSPWSDNFLGNLSLITNSIAVLEDLKKLTLADLSFLGIPPPSSTSSFKLIYRVVVRLDVSRCQDQCPQNAEEALKRLYAALARNQFALGPYSVRKAYTEQDPPDTAVPWYYIVVGVVLILVVGVLVILVGLGKRRRIMAKIWWPNSPSDADHTSSPSSHGGCNGVAGGSSPMTKDDEANGYIEMGSKKSKMEGDERHVEWVDDTVGLSSSDTSSSPSKAEPCQVVIGQYGRDTRQWDLAHASDVGKLVDQYRRQNGSSPNVNTAGPGGFTPLMLAVMRRPGALECIHYQSRSSSESSSDDQTALLPALSRRGTPHQLVMSPVDRSVATLVEAKADLNAVNDYCQSALQLAAASSRPEYVDLLLEAGANPNIPDNWGQTALHAAVGAGAEGAFMVLLNCPRTKINVRADGGITPLMAAVKMVNSFMVKQLLKKDSEVISATDKEGRTAVHWAAMVDNYEALRILISRGPDTIKDAQDCKGQTALFLACREGSVLCVKHLLDCFANVTLLDHLDQSPMQIAMQKQYGDVMELLRASAHGPMPYIRQAPPGASGYAFPPDMTAYPSSGQQQMTSTNSKKKKSKAISSGGAAAAAAAAAAASTGSSVQQMHEKYMGRQQPPSAAYMGGSGQHLVGMSSSDIGATVAVNNHVALSSPYPTGPHQSPPQQLPAVTSHYILATVPPSQSPPLQTTSSTSTSLVSHRHNSNASPPNASSYSNPTPPGYSIPTPPGGYSIPTPPGGYTNPTPPGGYSNHTSHTYEKQLLAEGEQAPVTTPAAPPPHSSGSSLQHPSIMEASCYSTSRYPPSAPASDVVATETRPLQHLTMETDATMQISYGHSDSMGGGGAHAGAYLQSSVGVYSPPQSGGSVSHGQSSPHSMFPSPPNSNSPQSLSLTPSPEARATNIHATGSFYVEGTGATVGMGTSFPHVMHHHHLMGATPI